MPSWDLNMKPGAVFPIAGDLSAPHVLPYPTNDTANAKTTYHAMRLLGVLHNFISAAFSLAVCFDYIAKPAPPPTTAIKPGAFSTGSGWAVPSLEKSQSGH